IVGRLASRIGSPLGTLDLINRPIRPEPSSLTPLGLALARGPGSSYLDPISTRFAANCPPTAQPIGLGAFVARLVLAPRLRVIPTQPLVHNSSPLQKRLPRPLGATRLNESADSKSLSLFLL